MDAVLYGPDGFYMTEACRAGRAGDFVTSVEIGDAFGLAIAELIPEGARVADVGGGRGTLARSIGAHSGAEVAVVDISPEALAVASQAGLIVAETVANLPWTPDVVIAHELLDNIPARLVSRAGELVIGPVEGASLDAGIAWYRIPLDPEASAYVDRYLPEPETGCGVVAFPERALGWLQGIDCDRLLIFDYGDTAARLAARSDWPLRAYAKQRRVDPLEAASGIDCDVTVDVPSDAICDRLVESGWRVRLSSQHEWLERSTSARAGNLAERSALTDSRGMGGFFVIEATRKDSAQ